MELVAFVYKIRCLLFYSDPIEVIVKNVNN